MANVSAQQVRDLVIDRLASGAYPLWSKLPTSRELAKELGAHRNTVAKAYQSLAEMGLVTLKQGRGTYVTDRVEEIDRLTLLEQLRATAASLILKARWLNVPREDLEEWLRAELEAQYASSTLRAAFVECNNEDIEGAIQEIELMTGVQVASLLLAAIEADVERATCDIDVIFTSLPHVKEVSTLLATNAPDMKVVGIYTQPDEEALSQIAQLKPGSRALVVVSNSHGGQRLEAQIQTVAAVTTQLLVLPTDDELQHLAPYFDVVVCSRSRARQLTPLGLPTPVIVLPFHISQHSAVKIADALVEPREVVAG